MARGVSQAFLDIVDQEVRTGVRHIWLAQVFLVLVIVAAVWFAPLSVAWLAAATAGRRVGPQKAEWILAFLALWIAETFLVLVAESAPQGVAEALPFAIVNGLFAGALLMAVSLRTGWAKGLRASLDDMIADGELGVWGER